MKGPRWKSAMRSILNYFGRGLIWMGVPFRMDAAVADEMSSHARHPARSASWLDNVSEHPDQLTMTPLSSAERAEWAALVERLR